jgi:hypothetical protein
MTDLFSVQDKSTASSDPCQRGQPLSAYRILVMTLCFIIMLGGFVFLFPKPNQVYRVQIVSIFVATAAVILYTFSANKNGMRPFMFSCPIVRRTIPRLLRRHFGFLAILLILETVAFRVRPDLPTTWTTTSDRDWSPFTIVLGIVCAGLLLAQIFSNRSLLETVHLDAEDEVTG